MITGLSGDAAAGRTALKPCYAQSMKGGEIMAIALWLSAAVLLGVFVSPALGVIVFLFWLVCFIVLGVRHARRN